MVESIEQNQKKMSNIQDFISNREERHQKIQLWSNLYESEYALRLAIAAVDDYSEDLFLAKTDPNTKYTHIVAESDYFEDFRKGGNILLGISLKNIKKPFSNTQKKNIRGRINQYYLT
jgi:hypothetical protein